ncbi:MAG: nitrophenyl compound nitroreductase subunit ArsF family protein [Bryobacteraceae bacterium]|nr:nitrophenyl compound nitroreductase subunit ArsF family protein [Bryobacteraceae bacterium]
MNYRAVLKYCLLAFVAVCVAYLMLQRSRSGGAAPDASLAAGPVAAATTHSGSEAGVPPSPPGQPVTDAAPAAQPAASRQRVRVYYFYTTVRCPTCRAIETYTADTLRQSFADVLSDGTLEWHPVNVQLPQNRHFIQDYQLFTKSVVISRVKEGRQVEWKNLERVWELAGNREAFQNYIRGEVRA